MNSRLSQKRASYLREIRLRNPEIEIFHTQFHNYAVKRVKQHEKNHIQKLRIKRECEDKLLQKY